MAGSEEAYGSDHPATFMPSPKPTGRHWAQQSGFGHGDSLDQGFWHVHEKTEVFALHED